MSQIQVVEYKIRATALLTFVVPPTKVWAVESTAPYDNDRVTIWHYGSSSHRVVEQQLLILGFLPEFLETSSLRKFVDFFEKLPPTGIEPGTAGYIKEMKLQSFLKPSEVSENSSKTSVGIRSAI